MEEKVMWFVCTCKTSIWRVQIDIQCVNSIMCIAKDRLLVLITQHEPSWRKQSIPYSRPPQNPRRKGLNLKLETVNIYILSVSVPDDSWGRLIYVLESCMHFLTWMDTHQMHETSTAKMYVQSTNKHKQ